MTDQIPVAGTEPVKVGLGRSNISVTVLLLGFLVAIVWFAGHGAWTSTDSSARFLGFAIAAGFAIPLVMLLRHLPRFVSPRYVIVDEAGLAIQHGKEKVLVPWQDVYAVGIGYEVAEEEATKIAHSFDDLKDEVSEYLSSKAMEALQVSPNRRLVLEIFPVQPDASVRFPRLKPYWKALPPPAAGLPEFAWRFPLPPVVSIARQIAVGLAQRVPQRWLGWFPRPWSGSK
jgi:hypothetical protein